MKSFILRLMLVLIVIPGLCFVCIRQLDRQGFFNLKQTQIVLENTEAGHQYLNTQVAKLNELLSRFNGVSLWSLEMVQISEQIKSQKWIHTAHISRSWPAGLTVRVQPEEIRFLMMDRNEAEVYPITAKGEILDSVSLNQAPDVAVLEGDIFSKPEYRIKAAKVFDQVPATGSFSRSTISSVRYEPKDGFWLTMVRDGLKVKMGEDQIAIKSLRVGQVVDYLEKHEEKASLIDANLSKKVHVRLSR